MNLFVVDPLAAFLPGRSESDAGTLLEMLQPLQQLASTGVAVLLLHQGLSSIDLGDSRGFR